MDTLIREKIRNAPTKPGVYIFYRDTTPLYIGKASHLRNRLKSYLRPVDSKTQALDQEATSLKLVILRSNIEALIKESQLIKSLKPKYNILWRDDKNYFYVAITQETFPRIAITHQPTSETRSIGPFTDGNALKAVLRLLRRHFPYCTCLSAGRPASHYRLCLNAQINNCPGYCCNARATPTRADIQKYQKTIRRIAKILTGADTRFLKNIQDPYELLVLDTIWQHKPYLNASESELKKIECYDNSHLSGKEAVGAMTALIYENGAWSPAVNSWRKFKIIGDYTEDDPRMMTEIVSRRLNHPEWPYPDAIIIDGGITQYRAAQKAFRMHKIKNIRLLSFAKPQQLVFGFRKKPVPLSKMPLEWQRLIPRAIHQTHNFVLRYHRRTRQRQFLKNTR